MAKIAICIRQDNVDAKLTYFLYLLVLIQFSYYTSGMYLESIIQNALALGGFYG
jgi:hypothetical protein